MRPIYILSDTPIQGAVRLPLIRQLFYTPSIDFTRYDYLIFTSKNGVLAAQRIDPSWKKVPALVIGRATAKRVEELGGQVAYMASSFYGERLARELRERFEPTKRYLFLRPEVVATPLGELLREGGFGVEEAIVYATHCVECEKLSPPPKGSIILFSSPSTVRCFFRCFGWDESYQAYAIGKKSAAAIPNGIEVRLCEGSTLQECVDLISRE